MFFLDNVSKAAYLDFFRDVLKVDIMARSREVGDRNGRF